MKASNSQDTPDKQGGETWNILYQIVNTVVIKTLIIRIDTNGIILEIPEIAWHIHGMWCIYIYKTGSIVDQLEEDVQ